MTKIGLTATVKAPRDMLRYFIEHHRALGVDEMVIFLDDPAQMSEWSGRSPGFVDFVACDDAYWASTMGHRPEALAKRQKHNVNYAKDILAAKGCDWLLHLDVDELLRPVRHHSLREELESCEGDCLRFTLREAVGMPARKCDYFAARWFKKKPSSRQIRWIRLLGCGRVLHEGEFLRGHTASKCAVRICERIRSYGVHYPVSAGGELRLQRTRRIQLLHFDATHFEMWVNKAKHKQLEVRLEVNHTLRENRKMQFRQFSEANNMDEDAAFQLYLRLYTLTPREKLILMMLGLLQFLPPEKWKYPVEAFRT